MPVMRKPMIALPVIGSPLHDWCDDDGDQRRDHDRARDGAGSLAADHLPDISHL